VKKRAERGDQFQAFLGRHGAVFGAVGRLGLGEARELGQFPFSHNPILPSG